MTRPVSLTQQTELPRVLVKRVLLTFVLDLGSGGDGETWDALFGCWHKNMSFPLSARQGQRRSQAATQTGTYVVCLDCGREFAYDWKTMRVVSGDGAVTPVHSHIEVEAKAS